MNLVDSVMLVLKNKTQNIFSEFWKDDLKNLLREVKGDVSHFFKSSTKQLKNLREKNFHFSFHEMKDSISDAFTIFKVIPKRVKEGFVQFREDFVEELEKQPDQKHKTILCLKVLGALSSFAVGAIYNLKMGSADFSFLGLKKQTAFTKFLIAELIFKISQVFIMRFLSELEKHLTNPDELNNLHYFKALLSDRDKLERERENLNGMNEPDDPAIQMVERLKNYIMTGEQKRITYS